MGTWTVGKVGWAPSLTPDWQYGAVNIIGAGVATITLNLGDPGGPEIPAGDTGDTIVLFMVSDYNGSATPVLTGATFYDSGAATIGSLTVVSQTVGPLDQCILTLTGTRPAGWAGGGIELTFSPGAGDYVYAVGDFPAGSLANIGFEVNYTPYGSPPRTAETISAPGSGVFAGMMVTDYDSGPGDGPYSVTPTGSGEYVDAYVASASNDYDLIVWGYRGSDAEFDMVGNYINYAIVLSD